MSGDSSHKIYMHKNWDEENITKCGMAVAMQHYNDMSFK
jgi:hypothetical protein